MKVTDNLNKFVKKIVIKDFIEKSIYESLIVALCISLETLD